MHPLAHVDVESGRDGWVQVQPSHVRPYCTVVQVTARGQNVADAAIRIVASCGVGGVSIRRVAAEAGVSAAQVQYYFRTRQDLVTAALVRIEARMQSRVQLVDRTGEREEVLHRLLWSWLPPEDPGDDRTTDCRAWVQFVAAGVGDPTLAGVLRQWDREVQSALATFLSGEREPGDRATVEAARVLAVVDGLAPRLLNGSMDHGQADAVVTAAVRTAVQALR